MVSAVVDMAEGGQRPDRFTFSAIFNACQRADEAELALDVARSAPAACTSTACVGNCVDKRSNRMLCLACTWACVLHSPPPSRAPAPLCPCPPLRPLQADEAPRRA